MTQDTINSNAIPKYRSIYEYYKRGICAFRFVPGSRIDSITEIQKRFQVSRETAKQVLQMLCDEGLIIKAVGKGSFVADLAVKKEHWAVVMPFVAAQTEPLLYHLKQQALVHNRELTYYLSYNNPAEEVNQVGKAIHEGYQAVVVVPVYNESENAQFYSKLNTGFTQVILANHTMAGAYGKYVVQSYDLGVKRATRYLMKCKKGNLLFIRDDSFPDKNMVQELMESTFLSSDGATSSNRQCLLLDSVRQLTKPFIRQHRIEGIFCPTDNIAIKVLGRAKEWGIPIPDDVSLVSYGDTDLARYFTPAITSICGHQKQMATIIADLIMGRVETAPGNLYQHIIQPGLIIRET